MLNAGCVSLITSHISQGIAVEGAVVVAVAVGVEECATPFREENALAGPTAGSSTPSCAILAAASGHQLQRVRVGHSAHLARHHFA